MERIKLFENNDMKLLEQDVNKVLSKFSPSIIVKDIHYEMFHQNSDNGSVESVWTAMVRYENNIPSSMPPEMPEGIAFDAYGRPMFDVANKEELADAIAAYAGELETPYIVRLPIWTKCVKKYAFNGCNGLTLIIIPDSVTSIECGAFSGCSNLTSIEIPNSVTSIEVDTFNDCLSLTSITIPNSVTSIECGAFSGCSNLTSIEIPNSVTSIEDDTFNGCSRLTSIKIPNSVTSIGEYAFYGCSSLASITIPDSVTSIGDYIFGKCHRLTSITIPNSVTSIGENAFKGCENLKEIHIQNPALLKDVDLSDCKDVKIITP